ncbi:sugar ABC transporter ATP-binding protein [Cytobacillus purgationiresistens]|uniref:ABC-type sugar transport system ATPase subunit n=1 Tax=Cytobacillus purgationiresistens TaxID=863449 RepID=A0ABU0AM88_9BACI|nr:sugar ABC transporter ATP-binding protein [Cytobacillus purgationiresistens]MDQ0272366.1 ABC-type sugar transport system ATPase subunit [Cytobacillus purgationiresistens]
MEHISKAFSGVQVLNDVLLHLAHGEVLGLLGENGAGKSTLMKILGGIVEKDTGEVRIEGKSVKIDNPRTAINHGISIIHQELVLVPELSATENIFLGRIPKGYIKWQEIIKQTEALFTEMGISLDARMPVGEMSIADQQMVEIAKSISQNAKIIVMDEPTSSLTERETEVLFKMIAKLKAKGVGIIYISHRMDEIFTICDKITVLRDGSYIDTRAISDVTENDIVRMMVGRDISKFFVKEKYHIGKAMLKVDKLSRNGVFNNISFEVKQGEVVGISGLLGAGRSEVAQAIAGIDPYDSGTLHLNEHQINIRIPGDAIAAGIAYVPEDRKQQGLFLQRSVGENLTIPFVKTFSKFGLVSRKKEETTIASYLSQFNVRTPNSKIAIQYLSGGNQQKVLLGRWLGTTPKVLILDEPTRGVDVGAKSEIYHAINELAKDGMAILLISSDLLEILSISDRILVMHEGRLNGEIGREEATEEIIMKYATGVVEV